MSIQAARLKSGAETNSLASLRGVCYVTYVSKQTNPEIFIGNKRVRINEV